MTNFRKVFVPLVAIAICSSACIPERRICWNADGKIAAVATPTGLYFIDDKGAVLPPKLETGTPTRAVWFHHASRLAVAHSKKVKSWSDVEPIFEQPQIAEITALAKLIHQRAMAYSGDWDKFKLDPSDAAPSEIQTAAFLYMRDKHNEGLAAKVGDKWTEFEKLEVDLWSMQVFDWSDKELKAGPMIFRTLSEIGYPKVSPDDKLVAAIVQDGGEKSSTPSLYVSEIAHGKARLVSRSVSVGIDWSSDSRSLAYLRISSPDNKDERVQLGSLTTICVAGNDGKLLGQWAENKNLVGVLFSPMANVHWMKDGRIMFSSFEVTLPATSRDMPQEWSVFVYEPRTAAGVARVIGRDFSGNLSGGVPEQFELSPDEKRLLLPGKNAVNVYDLASGATTNVATTGDFEGYSRSLPVWQNNDWVTLVIPSKQNLKIGDVALWKNDKVYSRLSENWPAKMKQGWLVDNK